MARRVMLGALLVRLPVHAGGAFVVNLNAVHATIALAGFRVLREDHRERDVAAAVFGPALEDREIVQGEAFRLDDFVAGGLRNGLREEATHFSQLGGGFSVYREGLPVFAW